MNAFEKILCGCVVALVPCAGASGDPPAHVPPYPVWIQPSLRPQRSVQEVVGVVPRRFGGPHMSGRIEGVELVAFVATCHLGEVDPRVNVPEDVPRVWYVRLSGSFSVSVMGFTSMKRSHSAYYLVDDRSGEGVQAGIFPDEVPTPERPDAGRLASECS